jgi:DnaK suppressor protein
MASTQLGLVRLHKKEKHLKEEIVQLEIKFKEAIQTPGNGHATDPADMPATNYAGTQTRQERLGQLRRALNKVQRVIREILSGVIGDDEYGFCRDADGCGCEIPAGRLKEFPEATLCVACKSQHEKKGKEFPGGIAGYRVHRAQKNMSYALSQ